MCFHSKQTKLALEVENRFKATIEKKELFKPSMDINGFDFGINPVITDENPRSCANPFAFIKFFPSVSSPINPSADNGKRNKKNYQNHIQQELTKLLQSRFK
jgi:hypothetical protein